MTTKHDSTSVHKIDIKKLKRKVIIIAILAFVILCLVLFLPAWSLKYWQAWVYLALLFIPMSFLLVYLLKHDPELLIRRMQMKEKEIYQRRIIIISWVFFAAAYIVPGFDVRYGWSHIPLWVIIIADMFVLAGYLMVAVVFLYNKYASRIIEVAKDQKVISTGPYAIIRHPMYTGVIIMYTASPLALGSYWALLPALITPIIIIFRIFNEEKVLKRDLEGYTEYTHKVRYRLIPGIW